MTPVSSYRRVRMLWPDHLGLARGKQEHDKRASEKDRDWAREKSRVMRQHNKDA